ncbi:MAG TPA: hypothetical protein VFB04_14050 [Terriglobales bacterium]|nr:hypothetical protein [Terriglobales bacterium]
MNKLITAVLAALMVAGGLSAISAATAVPSHDNTFIVGEGSSPVPVLPPCDSARDDAGSALNE